MKKRMIQKFVRSSLVFVLMSVMLSGCSGNTKQDVSKNEMIVAKESTETDSNGQEEANGQTETNTQEEANGQEISNEADTMPDNSKEITVTNKEEVNNEPKRMVMLDGKLYVDTGETSSMLRCGVMDFQIESVVSENEVPTVDNQSNFGTYSGQLGTRENRVEICIDDVWHIFAYNENSLEGVTMEVTKLNSRSAEVTFTSQTDAVVTYGDDYLLEMQDAGTGEWRALPFPEDVAFNAIGYVLQKGETRTWEAVFTYVYGELEPGKYRIIKKVYDDIGTREHRENWLMAELNY